MRDLTVNELTVLIENEVNEIYSIVKNDLTFFEIEDHCKKILNYFEELKNLPDMI